MPDCATLPHGHDESRESCSRASWRVKRGGPGERLRARALTAVGRRSCDRAARRSRAPGLSRLLLQPMGVTSLYLVPSGLVAVPLPDFADSVASLIFVPSVVHFDGSG